MLAELIQNIFDKKKKKVAPSTAPLATEPYTPNTQVTPIPQMQMPDAPVVKPAVPPVAPQLSPTQNTQSQIQAIHDKDYSAGKYADIYGNETLNPKKGVATIKEPGKDRDKQWSTGEKVLSFFRGMFNGDGAINAAMDRNYGEKYADRQEMARLVPQLKQQQDAEQFQQGVQYKDAQMRNMEEDNVRMRDKYDLDVQKAANQKGYYSSLKEYRDFLISDGTAKTAEQKKMNAARIKQIDERLKDYDLDRQSREKIAGAQIGSRERIVGKQLSQRESEFARKLTAKIQQDAAKGTLDKLKIQNNLEEDVKAGRISQETYEAQMAELNKYQ